jgi:hypothetical protein
MQLVSITLASYKLSRTIKFGDSHPNEFTIYPIRVLYHSSFLVFTTCIHHVRLLPTLEND